MNNLDKYIEKIKRYTTEHPKMTETEIRYVCIGEPLLRNLLDLYDNWNGTLVINDRNCDRYATVNFANLNEWLHEHRTVANAKVMAFGFYDGELCVRVDI